MSLRAPVAVPLALALAVRIARLGGSLLDAAYRQLGVDIHCLQ